MYAFIHIPKTAGSSMRLLLRGAYGARHCDIKAPKHKRRSEEWLGPNDLRHALRIYRNAAGICGHRVVPFMNLEQAAPELRYFTILRDPLKRCVSHFLHFHADRGTQETLESLKAFCADPDMRNVQVRYLAAGRNGAEAIETMASKVGFVGLSETFDESLIMFRSWLGNPSFPCQGVAINRSRMKPKWDILSEPESRAVVEEANQEDLILYRHVQEHIYPRQLELYDPQRADVSAAGNRDRSEGLWAVLKRNYVYKPSLHWCLG